MKMFTVTNKLSVNLENVCRVWININRAICFTMADGQEDYITIERNEKEKQKEFRDAMGLKFIIDD